MSYQESWKQFTAKKTPAVIPLCDEFYKHVPAGSNVLDFGCAWGRISFELHDRGYRATGFDINPNEIEWASRHAAETPTLESRASFSLADATDLPYRSGSFDAAVMVAFMVTLVDPEHRIKALQEAYRVVKDSGILCVSDFGQTWENEKYRKRYEEHLPMTGESGTFIVTDSHGVDGKELYRCHHYTEEELRGLIERQFRIRSWRNTTFTTPSGNTTNGFMIVASK